MRQRPENSKAAGEDPEATLVAPRFDADDARRAHPVVPLAPAPVSAPYAHAYASGGRARRRSWAPALFAVALLVVAALGGALAAKVLQSPRAERVQEQTRAVPLQTAEAPPPSQPSTPAAAEAPREDAPADTPAPRVARTRRARDAATAAPSREAAYDDYDDEDGERRGKAAEKRREREEELEKEMRKEMRKALKRAQGKAPRLVDVLTPSP